MFNAESYLDALIPRLQAAYAERLIYVGLQGSYLRREAHEGSDIDIMLVIDALSVADMDAYREIINDLPFPEKSCGFICSKDDLARWNPLEAFHVLMSTGDRLGNLKPLLPEYTRNDIVNFVKLSLNNLYHELCHRYIHSSRENNIVRFPGVCKGIFFIMQDLIYLRTGAFAAAKAELLSMLSGTDRQILEMSMTLKDGEPYDFDACFERLFAWCQETLTSL
ncbi:MAG: nucleotidyltransferase domain-containing protein [Clostridia bacterium]|nr:nucleotidyltransferase domain-containing protein [Clostridia bacterium]